MGLKRKINQCLNLEDGKNYFRFWLQYYCFAWDWKISWHSIIIKIIVSGSGTTAYYSEKNYMHSTLSQKKNYFRFWLHH